MLQLDSEISSTPVAHLRMHFDCIGLTTLPHYAVSHTTISTTSKNSDKKKSGGDRKLQPAVVTTTFSRIKQGIIESYHTLHCDNSSNSFRAIKNNEKAIIARRIKENGLFFGHGWDAALFPSRIEKGVKHSIEKTMRDDPFARLAFDYGFEVAMAFRPTFLAGPGNASVFPTYTPKFLHFVSIFPYAVTQSVREQMEKEHEERELRRRTLKEEFKDQMKSEELTKAGTSVPRVITTPSEKGRNIKVAITPSKRPLETTEECPTKRPAPVTAEDRLPMMEEQYQDLLNKFQVLQGQMGNLISAVSSRTQDAPSLADPTQRKGGFQQPASAFLSMPPPPPPLSEIPGRGHGKGVLRFVKPAPELASKGMEEEDTEEALIDAKNPFSQLLEGEF